MFAQSISTSLRQPLAEDRIRAMQTMVGRRFLTGAKLANESNFKRIAEDDLNLLFRLYDETFFDFAINGELRRVNATLNFRMSKRLTSAGAKITSRRRRRSPRTWFEIAVSTTLLGESFRADEEKHLVVGFSCDSRLQALQRLFEHELVHLLELLAFQKSSCNAEQFKTLAGNLFGHRCSRHQLPRPVDLAKRELGISIGDRISFNHNGQAKFGVVNRITKRATVLVLDVSGPRYSDGNRYQKYLVPLHDLVPVDSASSRHP